MKQQTKINNILENPGRITRTIRGLVLTGLVFVTSAIGYETGRLQQKKELEDLQKRCNQAVERGDYLESRISRMVVKFPTFEITQMPNRQYLKSDISGEKIVRMGEYLGPNYSAK